MQFNRLIVTNVERLSDDDPIRFIYTMTKEDAETPANQFCVAEIELLHHCWVKVTRHDTGVECFPPHRVVILELTPVIHAVADRPSCG